MVDQHPKILSFEAFNSPKIYFPMAQAEEKLGRDLDAIAHYEQLIADRERLTRYATRATPIASRSACPRRWGAR